MKTAQTFRIAGEFVSSITSLSMPYPIPPVGGMTLQKQGITEEIKATDQMKWVGLMNNIKALETMSKIEARY